MKKNYIITILLGIISVSTFGAKQPSRVIQKEKFHAVNAQRVKALSSAATSAVLLAEDFSKFTAGTEATPDATDITSEEDGSIAATFTAQEGWAGWGVYQAGGSAYLGWVKYSEYDPESADGPGYIVTPLFDASSASTGYTIKFRARSKSATGDVLAVYWNWYDETLEDFDYDGVEDLTITNQWAEYTVQATVGNADAYVDIYGTASEFYIDDIEIYAEGGGSNPPTGNVVFLETFGDKGASSNPRPKVSEYTDYDNGAPVTFSNTTTDYPDLRTTSTMDTHVWFPANKETDLVISNIPASGYSDLKLSFDVATGASGGSNLNKVNIQVNDVSITVPSVAITAQNKYVSSGDINIAQANTIKLRFHYTVANNPLNYGFRIDNVKITGTPPTGVDNPRAAVVYVANGQLIIEDNVSAEIEIYNISGVMVQKYPAHTAKIALDSFQNGVYLVKIGSKIQKVLF